MSRPIAALPALVCLGVLLGGCAAPATSTPQAAVSAEPTADQYDGGPVPEAVAEIVRRGGGEVEPGTFEDGGISADETVSRFRREYTAPSGREDVTVYAAIIRESWTPAMPRGLAVRLLHIPDVPQTIELPTPPPGAPPQDDTVMTDLVAFFNAQTAEFYETSFIGQPSGGEAPSETVTSPAEPSPSAESHSQTVGEEEWREPEDYRFRLQSSCGERAFLGRFRIKVEDHTVVHVTGLDRMGRHYVDSHGHEEVPTLKSLMDSVEDAQQRGADVATAEYGPPDGQPVRAMIDASAEVDDDEQCYVVDDYIATR